MTRAYIASIVGGLLSLCAMPSCSQSSGQGECQHASDCAAFERCDFEFYVCVCRSDEACGLDEYCNPTGSCQKKSGCFSNADCQSPNVCDVVTGQCIPAIRCSADFQCDLGQICKEGECRLGCHNTGDCQLSRREVCVSGSCQTGFCETTGYCPFGQICQTDKICANPIGPFCTPDCSKTCAGCTDLKKGPCGDPRNLCASRGSSTFCWVACETETGCPSGYDCQPASVSWAPPCQNDSDCWSVSNTCGVSSHRCALNQQPCTKDSDCEPFVVKCELGSCAIGHYCRPPNDCP